MATLREFEFEEKAALVACVYALHDSTQQSYADIANDTGLSLDTVRG
jgi:hypothetical protein